LTRLVHSKTFHRWNKTAYLETDIRARRTTNFDANAQHSSRTLFLQDVSLFPPFKKSKLRVWVLSLLMPLKVCKRAMLQACGDTRVQSDGARAYVITFERRAFSSIYVCIATWREILSPPVPLM
jgi:hypothetical protein